MSTGTAIIKDALKEIGAHSAISPAAPESIEDGRKKLNSMLEMWLSRNIIIGTTPIDQAGEAVNEPDDCRNGIVANLALLLTPPFSNGKQIVTPDLRATAKREFAMIKGLYGSITIPGKVLSSTLPVGAGNMQGGGFNDRTFWQKGKAVDN